MIEFIKNSLVNAGNEAAKIFVTGDITEATVTELTKDIELCKNSGVKTITFCINSPGGSVSDGMALYDIVCTLNDVETIAEIQGLCASAATYLPLACDKIVMHNNSDFMIHEPQGGFYGTVQQAEADLEYFNTLRERIIALYCSRTNKTPEEIEVLLGEAKFLNAKTCKELGFIDEIIGEDEEPEQTEEEQPEQTEEKPAEDANGPENKEEQVDEGSDEDENKCKKPNNLFSFENIIALLKKNNISMIKAEDDEFAKQEEVVNSLTEKVKNLELQLDAKQKSYDEMVNRLEDTKKDFDKKLQMAVADKIASFGYDNSAIPAPEKCKKMTDVEFQNALKEIYTTKGYKAAEEFTKMREIGEV